MFKVGRRVLEADCPLCDTIYLLQSGEVTFCKDYNHEEFLKGKANKPGYFYCPECNRNVYLQEGRYHVSLLKDPVKEIDDGGFAYKD